MDQHNRAVHRDRDGPTKTAEVGGCEGCDARRHAVFSLAWTAAVSMIEYSSSLTALAPCDATSINILVVSSRFCAAERMRAKESSATDSGCGNDRGRSTASQFLRTSSPSSPLMLPVGRT